MKHLPNAISALRFLGAVFLLFFRVESCAFWVIYFVCGLSDMADGYLARKLGCESKTGALLDSLADLAFVACCCYKLTPSLVFPKWLWIWGGAIVAIKIINQISALVMYKKCVFPHTIANKVTGALLFVGVPITLWINSIVPIIIIAVVATFAAVQEGHFIRTGVEKPRTRMGNRQA
ncbi:MAG: CDP-alcohol phosphatidyltransferase family protein [Bacteroidales bacterium]|nr:CDP-alcohol phosphatidyltransferase family protein [Bacteroidales bacterium]